MIKYLCSKKRRHMTMAKKDDRSYVTIKCSECKKFTYTTPKNKKNTTEKVDNLDKKITEKEATAIYAIMTRKGVDVVPNLKKNYNITNTKDLTRRQYISILTVMKKMPDKTTTTESQKDATATPNEDKKQTTNNMKE
jgi:ribosomal protein L33